MDDARGCEVVVVACRTIEEWVDYGEALAFVGNSILAPMNQTGTAGLEPEFWANFPSFDDARVAEALNACEAYAREAQDFVADGGDAVQRASVEYTKLFVGPPSPAAAPWETMHRTKGNTVGFGEPTFAMQKLLREAGLEVSNKNNQYADHMGIELLYASVLCTRAAEALSAAGEGAPKASEPIAEQLSSFLREHPLGWIDSLVAAVEEAAPNGYIAKLLALAKALMTTLA